MGRGVFITFEGGDGSGKSTQIHALALALRHFGRDVLEVREPGGTPIGERIRSILLDPDCTDMTDACELLLYEAARAQIVAQVIEPALVQGKVVLCDRFTDSTVAYQGYGRGLPLDVIGRLNELSTDGCMPDRTILIEVEAAEGLERATRGGSDRLEEAGDAFHERVNAGFIDMARDDARIRTVHTEALRMDTALSIFDELSDLFPDISSATLRGLFASDHAAYFSGHVE